MTYLSYIPASPLNAYIDDLYPNFVYRLNLVNGTGYSVTAFPLFTGKDVLTLWSDYQATL